MVTYRNIGVDVAPGGGIGADVGTHPGVEPSLVIDADERVVRGALFDSVEGHSRFVAGAQVISTAGPPIGDLSVAVREIAQAIESQCGVVLTSSEDAGDSIGTFSLTGQPVKPIRVTIVPTGRHQILPALETIARTTTSIVNVLDVGIRTEDGVMSATLLESWLRGFRPHVVVLLEGSRAQSEWISAVATIGNLLNEGFVDQLVVLASDEFQQHVIDAVGDGANVTGLDPGQYEPHEVAMALETELTGLYQSLVEITPDVGLRRRPVFVNRLRAGDLTTRFIARRQQRNTVSIDVSSGTTICWSSIQAGGSQSRPDLDLNRNARALFGSMFEMAWSMLPTEVSREDLANWVLNRAARPRVTPATNMDEIIQGAFLAAITARAWSDLAGIANDQLEIVIGGPAYCFDDNPGVGVLALLNGFQPAPLSGLCEIHLDPDGLLTLAGAVGETAPSVAADVIEFDLLGPSATVIVVDGAGVEGKPALAGRLTYEDGDFVGFDVPCGRLKRLEFGDGDTGILELTCEAGFSIGGSNPGERIEFGRSTPLRGGEVGIIIDARGRPVSAHSGGGSTNRETIGSWYRELGVQL